MQNQPSRSVRTPAPLHQSSLYPNTASTGNLHLGQGTSHLANAMLQQQGRRGAPSGPMGRSPYAESLAQQNIPNTVNSGHPLQSLINPLPPPMLMQHASPTGHR